MTRRATRAAASFAILTAAVAVLVISLQFDHLARQASVQVSSAILAGVNPRRVTPTAEGAARTRVTADPATL